MLFLNRTQKPEGLTQQFGHFKIAVSALHAFENQIQPEPGPDGQWHSLSIVFL